MSYSAPPVLSIRDFNPAIDAAWLHDLWHRALHERWSISLMAMLSTLADAGLLLVAACEGLRSGFCAVQAGQQGSAGLILLLVEPARQRSGVGTGLMACAVQTLGELNVQRMTLGAGSGEYFWPGLPAEQGTTWPFFRKLGFQEEEPAEDLIQELQDFTTPGWIAARLVSSYATVRVASAADQSRIAAFERQEFPAWASHFEDEMEQGEHGNILFAQKAHGIVVGTLLMRPEMPVPWTSLVGKQAGTLNALGVSPERQGNGIGLALAAGAMEVLRSRGCSHCLIQWTGLAEWYGKLGARSWAKYQMASKLL